MQLSQILYWRKLPLVPAPRGIICIIIIIWTMQYVFYHKMYALHKMVQGKCDRNILLSFAIFAELIEFGYCCYFWTFNQWPVDVLAWLYLDTWEFSYSLTEKSYKRHTNNPIIHTWAVHFLDTCRAFILYDFLSYMNHL